MARNESKSKCISSPDISGPIPPGKACNILWIMNQGRFDDIYFQLFIVYVARVVEFLILILCEVSSWVKGIAV